MTEDDTAADFVWSVGLIVVTVFVLSVGILWAIKHPSPNPIHHCCCVEVLP